MTRPCPEDGRNRTRISTSTGNESFTSGACRVPAILSCVVGIHVPCDDPGCGGARPVHCVRQHRRTSCSRAERLGVTSSACESLWAPLAGALRDNCSRRVPSLAATGAPSRNRRRLLDEPAHRPADVDADQAGVPRLSRSMDASAVYDRRRCRDGAALRHRSGASNVARGADRRVEGARWRGAARALGEV